MGDCGSGASRDALALLEHRGLRRSHNGTGLAAYGHHVRVRLRQNDLTGARGVMVEGQRDN